jgi:hypothetical protein
MAEESLLEQIQRRAYEIWLSEGCPLGRDGIHWVRAEAEFREKLAAPNASAFLAAKNLGVRTASDF